MPFIHLLTTEMLTPERESTVLDALSAGVSKTMGKPELYVMAAAATANMRMSGKAGPAAFIELRSIGGLDGETNNKLARLITDTLGSHLGIAPERVFINFKDVDPTNWAWRGETFA